jgi:hypothetical protein
VALSPETAAFCTMISAAWFPNAARHRPRSQLSGLPTGTMVLLPENPHQSWMVRQGHLFPWTHGGYGTPVAATDREVLLITPPATVGALARGYRPTLHPTVTRFSE